MKAIISSYESYMSSWIIIIFPLKIPIGWGYTAHRPPGTIPRLKNPVAAWGLSPKLSKFQGRQHAFA